MLEQISGASVERLSARIAKEIKALNHFEKVTEVGKTTDNQGNQRTERAEGIPPAASQPTLVLEGFIDDFTAGIPKLRIIEKGNNHAVITVRVLLRDKQSAHLLGEKNITIENARVTSNVERMVDKSAHEIAGYVKRSAARHDHTREAHADVQN
jgi:hypothetical protein